MIPTMLNGNTDCRFTGPENSPVNEKDTQLLAPCQLTQEGGAGIHTKRPAV